MQVDKHIVDRINDAHEGVVQSSQDAIQYAITAGQELNRIKDMAEHGEFLDTLNSGIFKFRERTAQRYMRVANYSAKTTALSDLQEAYRLVESEEAKKKQAEQANQRQRLEYRSQHNEKPATWQRSDDYAWQKLQKEREERDERISKAKEQMSAQAEQKAESKRQSEHEFESIRQYISNEQSKIDKMSKLKISNQNGSIIDLLDSYLSGLSTDSQRMEECHNIIKYCKDIANRLQRSEYEK